MERKYCPWLTGVLVVAMSYQPISAILMLSTQRSYGRGIATKRMDLISPAFANGQSIPRQYTADGHNISPPLEWSNVPVGTKELALICDDPDAPPGTWVHWVIWGLSPKTSALAEGLSNYPIPNNGAGQGTNSFGKIGWDGPSPPPGRAHRYCFKLFALNCNLKLPVGSTSNQFGQATQGHVLGMGQLVGTYGR